LTISDIDPDPVEVLFFALQLDARALDRRLRGSNSSVLKSVFMPCTFTGLASRLFTEKDHQ